MGSVDFVRRSIAGKTGVFLTLLLAVVFGVFVTVNHLLTARLYGQALTASIEGRLRTSGQEIDRLSGAMEQKALELASVGGLFAGQASAHPGLDLRTQAADYLTRSIRAFPDGLGGGLWYEPGVLGRTQVRFGPYAFWDKGSVTFTWDLDAASYDYPNQSWYLFALPKDWDRGKPREKAIYWTPPYVDEAGSNALMITADAFIHGPDGRILGLSTVDWSLDTMITLLDQQSLAPGSRQFLVDLNSATVLNFSADPSLRMKPVSALTWLPAQGQDKPGAVATIDRVVVGGREYRGFTTRTAAGFLFGSLVPLAEINRPMDDLFATNLGTSTVSGLLLLLSVFLLLRGMLRPMVPLVAALDQAAHGDLTVALHPRSQDELGVLARHVNTLLDDWKAALAGVRDLLARSAASSEVLLRHADRIEGAVRALDTAMTSFAGQFEEFERALGRATGESAQIDDLVHQEVARVGDQKVSVDRSRTEWTAVLTAIAELRTQTQSNQGAMDALTGRARTSESVLRGTLSSIQEIARSAELIAETITVIDDVAAQTNLLAMNAAIEAAHAGTAGRGFGVVADEIRKLAEATGGNSKQISESLKGVLAKVANTEAASLQTAQAMEDLVGGIMAVSKTAETIARSLAVLHDRGEGIQRTFEALGEATQEVLSASGAITAITSTMKASFAALSENSASNRHSVDALVRELQVLAETSRSLQSEARVNRDQGLALDERLARFKTS